jgi:hypothetical protein
MAMGVKVIRWPTDRILDCSLITRKSSPKRPQASRPFQPTSMLSPGHPARFTGGDGTSMLAGPLLGGFERGKKVYLNFFRGLAICTGPW